jgi:hypothetical protein
MKAPISLFVLPFVLISSLSFGQDFITKKHSDQFIKNCIIEVFQDKSQVVFDSNSRRYELIKHFFKNQVSVEFRPEYKGKKFESTNDLNLNNKNNSNLHKDESYHPNTFNPLKYDISMNPIKKKMYRIGLSDYIMIISQSK